MLSLGVFLSGTDRMQHVARGHRGQPRFTLHGSLWNEYVPAPSIEFTPKQLKDTQTKHFLKGIRIDNGSRVGQDGV